MTTVRCSACLRDWHAGGPYACDCLDDATPPANDRVPRAALAARARRVGGALVEALGHAGPALRRWLGVRP